MYNNIFLSLFILKEGRSLFNTHVIVTATLVELDRNNVH